MFIEVYYQKGERNDTDNGTQDFCYKYIAQRINLSEVNSDDFTVHKTL